MSIYFIKIKLWGNYFCYQYSFFSYYNDAYKLAEELGEEGMKKKIFNALK